MKASEFIKLLPETIKIVRNNSKFHEGKDTVITIINENNQSCNEIKFIENQEQYISQGVGTESLGIEIRIKNDFSSKVACLKFSSDKKQNYPNYFNRELVDLCKVPEGVLFIPRNETDILCVALEMKSTHLGGSLNQLYAGKIITQFIIQTVLNSQKESIHSSEINFQFIGFRFAPSKSNHNLLRNPITTQIPQTRASNFVDMPYYYFKPYLKDKSFYYNDEPHPCYSSDSPQKMFLTELIKSCESIFKR